MNPKDLNEWNRKLVSETIELLEDSHSKTADAVSRLRGLLAVNPGGAEIAPAEVETVI